MRTLVLLAFASLIALPAHAGSPKLPQREIVHAIRAHAAQYLPAGSAKGLTVTVAARSHAGAKPGERSFTVTDGAFSNPWRLVGVVQTTGQRAKIISARNPSGM